MSDLPVENNANPHLTQGIAAARAGDKKKAIVYFLKALEQDKSSLEGWLWLARVVDDATVRRQCLQVVLKFDPQNLEAQFMQAELDRPAAEMAVQPPQPPPAIEPVEKKQPPVPAPPSSPEPAPVHEIAASPPPVSKPLAPKRPRWMRVGAGILIFSLLCLLSFLASTQLGWWGQTPTSPPPIARHTTPADSSSNLFVEYILDASNSMNEKFPDGESKLDAAKVQLGNSIKTYRPETSVGLRVYGDHVPDASQPAESCKDIQLIAPVEPGYQGEIASWLLGYHAFGMTPIASALQQAAADFTTGPLRTNSVVLISDGMETCGGDPCALVKQMEAQQVRFTLHVVGLNVDDPARQQLNCAAQAGGGVYQDAHSAQELKNALDNVQQQIIRATPVPPIPPPAVVPIQLPTKIPTLVLPSSTPQGLTYTKRTFNETGSVYDITIDYPYFSGPEALAGPLNEAVKEKTYNTEEVRSMRNMKADPGYPQYFIKSMDYKVEYIGTRVASMWFEWQIDTGGVHPNIELISLNFDLTQLKELNLPDLINSSTYHSDQIISYCNNHDPIKVNNNGDSYEDPNGWLYDINGFPEENILPAINILNEGILFQYRTNIRMMGNHTCLVPYDLLRPSIKPDAPLPPN